MHVFYGEHNYTMTLPLPDFFHDLGAKQVGGAKTPAYSSRVTKVSTYIVNSIWKKLRTIKFCCFHKTPTLVMNSSQVLLHVVHE